MWEGDHRHSVGHLRNVRGQTGSSWIPTGLQSQEPRPLLCLLVATSFCLLSLSISFHLSLFNHPSWGHKTTILSPGSV